MFRTYIDTNNPQGMQLRRFKNRTPARKTQDEDKQNKAQKQNTTLQQIVVNMRLYEY
jgi:hypothetical protein